MREKKYGTRNPDKRTIDTEGTRTLDPYGNSFRGYRLNRSATVSNLLVTAKCVYWKDAGCWESRRQHPFPAARCSSANSVAG